jgi:prepilin-type N-terminal cleavage/methylation domain-containing protein
MTYKRRLSWEQTMRLTKPNHLRVQSLPRRRRGGFSIIELLIVVILVGIVMSVAGLRVSAMMTQQRVVRAASTIQTDMEMAFAIAGRNREPMKMVFSSSSGAILFRVTDRTGATEYKRTDLKQLGLANGDVTASSAEITVFPNGFASDTLSILVSVTRNGVTNKRIVRMSRAGMVKVI